MKSLATIAQTLETHVRSLGGPRDPYLGAGSHQLAQQYISATFSELGELTPQRFLVKTREHTNWQLTLPGKDPKLAPIVVGAHFDTVPGSPGADDNASGVAAMLTLAELLFDRAQHQQGPKRTIYFVAFDLEEYGLVGSTTWAKRWREQAKPLHLMLSLEMLGYFSKAARSQQYPLDLLSRFYPDTGNFIALIGNIATLFKMRALKRQLIAVGAPCQWLPVINQGRQIPPTRYSDHAPFWDEGYSAIMVTDTANLRNPHYHTATDRPETLNFDMMAKITYGLALTLCEL
ncbi:MAG: M28 family peptidase [Cyanobacteria bacterium J06554_11]